MTDHLPPEPPDDDQDPLDLMAVGADDRLLDDLGQDLFVDLHDDPAQDLLVAWRASLQPHDLPAPPSAPVAQEPARRRALPMFAAAAAIVALLLGTAAIGSRAAGPDDMLWPLTKLLWPDRIASVAAAENAVAALDVARIALDHGEPPQASVVLTAAAQDIAKVQPRDGRAELDADYEQLWTQLEEVMAIASFPSGSLPTPTPAASPSDTRHPTSVPPTSGTPPTPATGTTGPTRPSTSGAATTAPVPPAPPTTTTPPTTTPPPTTTATTTPDQTTTVEPTTPLVPVIPTTPDVPTDSSSSSSSTEAPAPETLSPLAPAEESPAGFNRSLDTGSFTEAPTEVPAPALVDAGEN